VWLSMSNPMRSYMPGPGVQTWANAVKKAGNDPDAVLKDFKAVLAKYNSAY